MEEKVIELKSSYIWLEDGIIRVLAKKNVDQEEDDAKESIDAIIKLAAGKKVPVLLDISTLQSSTEEARKQFQSKKAFSSINGMAMLLNSPSSRLIGTLFLNLNLPNYPLKIFTSERKAVEWLQDYL
ncbi:MAG: STAS/SEC14 domain-containing protein [Flavobacteriales bacterium]|nr:STAS/SEC14 domain-containing protein [Flavobacteriales bacterium]